MIVTRTYILYCTSESDHLGPIDWVKIGWVMDLGSLVLNQFPSKIETLFLLIFEAEYPFPQKLGFIIIKKSLNLYPIAMPFN